MTNFLRGLGYVGKIPEVNLTSEENSFSVDSINKETGKTEIEKIYFSIHQLGDKNLDFSQLMAHELAHMNTYDEGLLGEETSLHTRKQVGTESKEKKMSEKERSEYLRKVEATYETKDIEKMYEEGSKEEDKEYFLNPLTFLLHSEMAGSPPIINKDDNSIIKIGNKLYYGDYEVVGIREWPADKSKYILSLDYNSKAPSEEKISTAMSVIKLVALITDPTNALLNSKELKNDVENLLNNEKSVDSDVNEVVKNFNRDSKLKIKEAIQNGKIKQEYSRTWTEEEIKAIPESKNSGIRELPGTAEDALKFFKSQVKGEIKTILNKKGEVVYIGKSELGTLSYRASDSSNIPSIQITGIKGVRKIKFIK